MHKCEASSKFASCVFPQLDTSQGWICGRAFDYVDLSGRSPHHSAGSVCPQDVFSGCVAVCRRRLQTCSTGECNPDE